MSGVSSRFGKTAKKTVKRGVFLYKVRASPYWYARIWNSSVGKYIVRSTKETSRLVAAEVAKELYSDLKQKKFMYEVPRTKTFIYFAEKLIKQQRRLAGKTRSSAFASDDEKLLKRNGDGIIDYFYKRDITVIRISEITEYLNVLNDNRTKPLSASSKNKHNIIIKKVLRLAYDYGVLQTIPPSPKIERKDNPRVSFSEEQFSYFFEGHLFCD